LEDAGVVGLKNPQSVVVSPDGQHLYVGANFDYGVDWLNSTVPVQEKGIMENFQNISPLTVLYPNPFKNLYWVATRLHQQHFYLQFKRGSL